MKSFKKYFKQTQKYHAWVFPGVCILIFLVLCIGKTHGSSIGLYRANNNPGVKDRGLLFGHPKAIRSDEWVVTSPLQYAQKAANYPLINPNIGNGQDMSLVLDVPVRDWSIIFKPQNLAFLFLPFSVAFSIHWWSMLLILLLCAYWLFKTLIPPPKNNLLSAVLATAFSISPFIMWWYAAGSVLPIAYTFLLLTLFIYLLNAAKLKHKVIVGIAMSYVAVCLALTFYTPFIFACCVAGLFIAAGYIFSQKSPKRFINKANILVLLGVVLAALIVLVIFYLGHKEAIQLIQNTVYPGHQTTIDKPVPLKAIFDVYKLFFLQSELFTVQNKVNQSEASNFVYLFIYFLVPAGYMFYEGIKKKKNDWLLILISLGIVMFIIRITGFGNVDGVYKVLYLDKASRPRTLIGLGVLNIAFVIAIIRNIKLRPKPLPNPIVWVSLMVTGLLLTTQYYTFREKFQFVIPQATIIIILLSVMLILIAWLMLRKQTMVYAAMCFLVLAVAMSFYINPLYRGVPFEKDRAIVEIAQLNQAQKGTWVMVENIALEQYPQMAGVRSISGVMLYPQYDVWKTFPGYDSYKDTINRYAHIMFNLNNHGIDTIRLIQPDLYTVNIDPCDDFAQQNITYLVGTKAEDSKCIEPVKIFLNNQQQIFIYKVVKNVI